jgi:hypothetical protein
MTISKVHPMTKVLTKNFHDGKKLRKICELLNWTGSFTILIVPKIGQ